MPCLAPTGISLYMDKKPLLLPDLHIYSIIAVFDTFRKGKNVYKLFGNMLCFTPPPFENTIAEENGIFACWKYRWYHGPVVFHCLPDASASGENMKKGRRESKISLPTFFNVLIVPVGVYSFVTYVTCGKNFV